MKLPIGDYPVWGRITALKICILRSVIHRIYIFQQNWIFLQGQTTDDFHKKLANNYLDELELELLLKLGTWEQKEIWKKYETWSPPAFDEY